MLIICDVGGSKPVACCLLDTALEAEIGKTGFDFAISSNQQMSVNCSELWNMKGETNITGFEPLCPYMDWVLNIR